MWQTWCVAAAVAGAMLSGGVGVAATSKTGVDAGAYQERRADMSRHARALTADKQAKRNVPQDPAALVEQFPEWSKPLSAVQVMRDHTERLH